MRDGEWDSNSVLVLVFEREGGNKRETRYKQGIKTV